MLAHLAASAPHPSPAEVLLLVLPPMALILVLGWRSQHRAGWVSLWLALAGGLLLARDQLAAGTHWVLLLQHVGINTALGLAFGRTLMPGAKPLISGMAEMVHGSLSARQMSYTRGATLAWTIFFGLMALASVLGFAFAPVAAWLTFVNLLTPPLVIGMFAAEYLTRLAMLPRAERAGFFQAVDAYRRLGAGDGKPH